LDSAEVRRKQDGCAGTEWREKRFKGTYDAGSSDKLKTGQAQNAEESHERVMWHGTGEELTNAVKGTGWGTL
jgi:hypothetical protein